MTKLGNKITKDAEEVAEHVETWIDGYIENLVNNEYNKKKRLLNLLKAYKLKKSESKYLLDWFSNIKNELQEVVVNEDPDLIEGYDFLSPAKLKKLYEFVCSICDDFESYSKITKKKRKRNPDVIVKNLKYMQSANVGKFKISSFDPKEILDCKSFVVYNTKTGDVSVYNTDSSFDINGTTIQDFSDSSFTKKIGRKADVLVPHITNIGHASAIQEINKVNTKSKPATGRINEHTILVRTLT